MKVEGIMDNLNLPSDAEPTNEVGPVVWGDAQAAMNVLVQQAHALGIYAEPCNAAPLSQLAGTLHRA